MKTNNVSHLKTLRILPHDQHISKIVKFTPKLPRKDAKFEQFCIVCQKQQKVCPRFYPSNKKCTQPLVVRSLLLQVWARDKKVKGGKQFSFVCSIRQRKKKHIFIFFKFWSIISINMDRMSMPYRQKLEKTIKKIWLRIYFCSIAQPKTVARMVQLVQSGTTLWYEGSMREQSMSWKPPTGPIRSNPEKNS